MPAGFARACAVIATLLLWVARADATLEPVFQERGVEVEYLLLPPCSGFHVFEDFAPDFGFYEASVTQPMTCEGVGTSTASLFEASGFQPNGFEAIGTSSTSYGGVALSMGVGGQVEIEVSGAHTFSLSGSFDTAGSFNLARVLYSTPTRSGRVDSPGSFHFLGTVGSANGPPESFELDFFFSTPLGLESASVSYDVMLRFYPVVPVPALAGPGRMSVVLLMLGTGIAALLARGRLARANARRFSNA
jgi:hypothetical protein